ncbi:MULTISPECIES: zinc-binding dehydrogenase [unclassified Variovorax]|uniref:zinc-binding dehydrogenase n=1 Tax=unclassified Variovorax TaxID=663243 RepID=UPI0034E860D9
MPSSRASAGSSASSAWRLSWSRRPSPSRMAWREKGKAMKAVVHSARLFGWIAEGKLKVHIGGVYPPADAARAHADMASRATTGKLLLVP